MLPDLMTTMLSKGTATPYTAPLTFRTEVRPYLYLASAGLFVLGLMFVGYSVWGPEGQGVMAALISGVGMFMLYIAWVNFWTTRAGYPHLILHGHRLTVQSSDAFRRHLDLSALGETSIVIISRPRASTRVYLCFAPVSGVSHKPSRFTHVRLQPFAETVLLNGYVGANLRGAKDIQRVIDARRAESKQNIVLPADDTAARASAKARLIATASVFAVGWVVLV